MANQRVKSLRYKALHKLIVDELLYNGKTNMIENLNNSTIFKITDKRIKKINSVMDKFENMNEIAMGILQVLGYNISYDCWYRVFDLRWDYRMGRRLGEDGKQHGYFELINIKPFQPLIRK